MGGRGRPGHEHWQSTFSELWLKRWAERHHPSFAMAHVLNPTEAKLDPMSAPDSGLALGGMTVAGHCNSKICSSVEMQADGKCTAKCEYSSYRQTIGESPVLLPFGAWLICEPGCVQLKEGSSSMRS